MLDGVFLTIIGVIASVLSWRFTFPSPAAKALQATFRWTGISWILIGLGQMVLDAGQIIVSPQQRIAMMVLGGFLCAAGITVMIVHAAREFGRARNMIEASEAASDALRKSRRT